MYPPLHVFQREVGRVRHAWYCQVCEPIAHVAKTYRFEDAPEHVCLGRYKSPDGGIVMCKCKGPHF
jgi:hypothetical protein